jgi:hypothetical protein
MSKKETDKRYGKRIKSISARITEADAEILKKNNISYSYAIEQYIDNNLNVYARQQYVLKQKEKQLAEIEKAEREKPALIKEIEDLRKSIGFTLIDGLEVSPQAKASAERFASLFINSQVKYNDLDEYIKENKKEITEKALEEDLTINAFSKLIYNEYETLFAEKESKNQDKNIALFNKYANVSENLSENALKQISNAVRVAERNILGKKQRYKDIDAYIKDNDKYIELYVSKCDLSKDKFINLVKEAFYNLIGN